jgi:hypothetical protein
VTDFGYYENGLDKQMGQFVPCFWGAGQMVAGVAEEEKPLGARSPVAIHTIARSYNGRGS